MCIIVLRCFVLVRFPNKMFEWATWWRWPTAFQNMTTMAQEKEKEYGKGKAQVQRGAKGSRTKRQKQAQKVQETICSRTQPIPGISNRTAKKCCCVLIFSLLSSILTDPKSKRVTTNPSAWCVLSWIICSDLLSPPDFALAFPGANVAPHGFPYGVTSIDTAQREFQHSSLQNSLHMTLKWQRKRPNSEINYASRCNIPAI